MAEVSFGTPNGSAPAPTPAPVAEVTLAAPVVSTALTENKLPAVTTESQLPAVRKLILGDKLPAFKDVILPRLNIVQGIGNLKDSFSPGELVFGQQTVLYTPPKIDKKTGNMENAGTPPVNLYVIGVISERFAEKIEGGFGGLIVDSEEDVRKAGGTLDYKEWELKRSAGMKRFENLVDLLVAIERPSRVADDDTVFNFPVDDKKFTIAAWACKGGAYTEAVKKVFFYHRMAGVLKDGYFTRSFAVSTYLKPFKNGNSAWMPVCVPKEKTSEGVLKFILDIAGTPA